MPLVRLPMIKAAILELLEKYKPELKRLHVALYLPELLLAVGAQDTQFEKTQP